MDGLGPPAETSEGRLRPLCQLLAARSERPVFRFLTRVVSERRFRLKACLPSLQHVARLGRVHVPLCAPSSRNPPFSLPYSHIHHGFHNAPQSTVLSAPWRCFRVRPRSSAIRTYAANFPERVQRPGFPQTTRCAATCEERTGQGGNEHPHYVLCQDCSKELPRSFTSRTLKRAARCVHTAAASG